MLKIIISSIMFLIGIVINSILFVFFFPTIAITIEAFKEKEEKGFKIFVIVINLAIILVFVAVYFGMINNNFAIISNFIK